MVVSAYLQRPPNLFFSAKIAEKLCKQMKIELKFLFYFDLIALPEFHAFLGNIVLKNIYSKK